MKFFAKTDLGKVRQVNQDYYVAENRKVGIFPNVFIVADGVGSNRDSGYASKHCSDFVIDQLSLTKDSANYEKELAKAYRLANIDLVYRIIANPKYNGMGTTMVCATIIDGMALIANVGDSRCYHITDDIIQITNDHSIAEELARVNEIERGTAKYYELKSQLSRAFGASKKIEPDFFNVDLRNGDYILLCTDGLTNMVSDEKILEIVKDNTSIETKVDDLIDEANLNGGKDNIAVILIYIDDLKKNDSVFEREKEELNRKTISELNKNDSKIERRSMKDILEDRSKKLYDEGHSRSRRKDEGLDDEG